MVCFGSSNAHRQLRGAACEGIVRDHTRQNHAAAVSALRIQNGDGGGGTHIDDDLREG